MCVCVCVCVCESIFWLHHWCSLSKKSMSAFPIRIRSYQVVNFAVNISLKSHGIIGVICGSVDGSLVPRPHPQGGKGSGELRQNPWACAEEFPRANEIAALAQSHDKLTAGMQHRYTIFNFADQSDSRFALLPVAGMRSHANAAIATNQNQALSAYMRMRCRTRTEDSAQVHQTLFLLLGWGLGTRLC